MLYVVYVVCCMPISATCDLLCLHNCLTDLQVSETLSENNANSGQVIAPSLPGSVADRIAYLRAAVG